MALFNDTATTEIKNPPVSLRPARMTQARQKVYAALAIASKDKDRGDSKDRGKSKDKDKDSQHKDKNQAHALSTTDLAHAAGVSANVVKGLVKAGALEKVTLANRAPFRQPVPKDRPFTFSPEQQTAAHVLCEAVKTRSFQPYLLDGVTGSGKTEVYFEAIAETLAQGRKALVLLPEISLTAQFLTRFEARFNCPPALWHSGLSASARRRTWRAVAEGQVSVLAGARSALFLPWGDELGLIIVDEEHDSSFKQEEGVIYNARDMAVLRAQFAKATIILSSATPTLETIVNAQNKRYQRLALPKRAGTADLPRIKLIDMRQQHIDANRWLALPIIKAIEETLANKTQSLLFLNRRGYAPLTLCRACGYRYACPHCDAWLVAHHYKRALICHHCGTLQPLPTKCDSCGAEDKLAACGPGIERITEEVTQTFPKARLAVLSSDLITNTDSLRETLAAIVAGKIDIIIGTQIIAKGHHFPKLAFVGVVDADLGLGNGDLRAGERVFQLLSQVAGRAGREKISGHAMLQTYMPEHPVMQALADGAREAFIEREKEMRQTAGMPPFGRLAGIILSGPDLPPLNKFAQQLAAAVPPHNDIDVFGPAPAPIARLRANYRVRFLVKGKKTAPLQDFIKTWLDLVFVRVKRPSKIRITIDIDPYRFL
ncbi:MAG: primosomal protein N' [Alphaproteobacteria bacterium]|nr:primosomal protein N' [Alphaproteobacteria bacterium]